MLRRRFLKAIRYLKYQKFVAMNIFISFFSKKEIKTDRWIGRERERERFR